MDGFDMDCDRIGCVAAALECLNGDTENQKTTLAFLASFAVTFGRSELLEYIMWNKHCFPDDTLEVHNHKNITIRYLSEINGNVQICDCIETYDYFHFNPKPSCV